MSEDHELPLDDVTERGSLLDTEGRKASLPDVLDVLVAGGGPAGTAAAFRARELGLSTLVVDYDDLLKRIRDFGAGKTIYPSYGKGGDKMSFPEGGDLVAKLVFEPILTEDMVPRWKAIYRGGGVPAQIGVELLEIERRENGHLVVKCFNHRVQEYATYRARNLVLAVGAGEARRFDIPGDTRHVATSLKKEDAGRFVGRPACVIGGGLSAAEAVIALSNAKAEAGDRTLVYWSYRGDGLPRVKKSISDVFFDAFVGNGNIHYLRRSEPSAVVTDPSGRQFLSIRVDRKVIEDRPIETVHLEFPKEQVVACIGTEPPVDFLGKLGIEMPVGPNDKDRETGTRRVVVTADLETAQPGVYLIGATLGAKYWEAGTFDDPASWKLAKYQDNIKSALNSGVRVAEAIRARTDGKGPERAPPAVPESPPAVIEEACVVRRYLDDVEEPFPIRGGRAVIGRAEADIVLANDALVSHRHAAVVWDENQKVYRLEDLESENGTWVELHNASETVHPGARILAGDQRFELETTRDGDFELRHYDRHGEPAGSYALPFGKRVAVGRNPAKKVRDGDVECLALARDDAALSTLHFRLTPRGAAMEIEDSDSTNGTLVRVQGSRPLAHGDHFVVGESRFTFEIEEVEVTAGAAGRGRTAETVATSGNGSGGRAAPAAGSSAPAAAVSAPARKPSTERSREVGSRPEAPEALASASAPARVVEEAPPPPSVPPAKDDSSGTGKGSAGTRKGTADETPAAPSAAGASGVTFVDRAGEEVGSFPLAEGKSLLEVARDAGILSPGEDWCLGKGDDRCGASAAEVIEGMEHLSPMGDDESKALAADPWGHDLDECESPCRFMCKAKLRGTGPVRLRLMEEY